MSERGYITIARGILDHPVVGAKKPYSQLEAWQWLLLEAAWKPHRVQISNGRTRGVCPSNGPAIVFAEIYGDKWGWSVKRITTFLNGLETDQMVATQTDTGQTLITICNYNTYQLLARSRKRKRTHKRARKGHAKGTKKKKGIRE